MGSLRTDLQLPAHFASTGSIEEEDDEDEDIMLMGTTPQVLLMQDLWQGPMLFCLH
jgi:hypothetical protein